MTGSRTAASSASVQALLRGFLLVTAVVGSLLALSPGPAVAATSAPGGAVPIYIVRAEVGGAPEDLGEIATRYLGGKAGESTLLALNQGRMQSDGGTVTASGPLRAGWVLQLPAAATGVGLQLGSVPGTAAPVIATSSPPVAAGAVGVAVLLLGAAAVWWFWWQRRGPTTSAGPSNRSRRRIPDGSNREVSIDWASWTLDRALRVLVLSCMSAEVETPEPYLVTLTQDRARLSLPSPRTVAPAPWSASEDGRVWTASLRDIQDAPVNDSIESPLPMLVILGTHAGDLVAADLGRVHGAIQLTGDTRGRTAVVEAWVDQLRHSPWSRADLPVTALGFDDSGLRDVSLAAELADVTESASSGTAGLLLLATANRRDASGLDELLASPRTGWTVLVTADIPRARWIFQVDSAGNLDWNLLDGPITVPAPSRA